MLLGIVLLIDTPFVLPCLTLLDLPRSLDSFLDLLSLFHSDTNHSQSTISAAYESSASLSLVSAGNLLINLFRITVSFRFNSESFLSFSR